jgi:hypothetical protein
MHNLIDYFVPVQDPIFGINSSNITKSLSVDNWQSKAVSFELPKSTHYVYLCQATSASERKNYYCVNTYDIDRKVTLSQRLFSSISEALCFANLSGNHMVKV